MPKHQLLNHKQSIWRQLLTFDVHDVFPYLLL